MKFRPEIYVKFFPKDLKLKLFQYSLGLNKDAEKFKPSRVCERGGLYYTSFKDMWDFTPYGPVIGIVKIPIGVPVIAVGSNKFKSPELFISEIYDFREFLKNSTLYPYEKFQDKSINNALLWASRQGHKDIVEFLMTGSNRTRVDIEAKNIYGWTALMLASRNGASAAHKEIVELLLEKKADIEANDSYGTALVYASIYGHKDIVEILLKNNADIEAKSSNGETALMLASRNGASAAHKEIVELLLLNGADVNAKDRDGWTALISASRNGHKEIVKILKNAT